MNISLRHIILCLFALPLLAGCREGDTVLSDDDGRTFNVQLDIMMTRADAEEGIGDDSRPQDLQLWIFADDADQALYYENITDPTELAFSTLFLNNLVQTIECVVQVEDGISLLHFYLLMNSTGIGVDADSTPEQIQAATFTYPDTDAWTGDNKVPIYGYSTLDVSVHRSEYALSIEATRAVGKLELFFTKESNGAYLSIDKIELAHVPDKGYVAKQEVYTGVTYEDTKTLFEPEDGQSISTSLSDDEAGLGYFSDHEDRFIRLDLSQAYLLENPNPTAAADPDHEGLWGNTTSQTDYVYPYDPDQPEGVASPDARYLMTVTYRTSATGQQKEQPIYLPRIARNEWNKIYARVKSDGQLTLQYKVLPWNKVESAIGYAPEPISTTDSPFGNPTEFNNFLADSHHYILLPLEAYDDDEDNYYVTTQALFNHLYENPNEGDNEARLCILTRPTYDTSKQYVDLKTGSAGARYFFMLTGPEGATWEAHLTNKEDFMFSDSESTDFAKNTDDFGNGKVRMVTHGIARKKPYIIQIIAKNLYTGYEPGMSGETTGDFDVDGFEHEHISSDKWESYFGDDYLTDWGADKWYNKKVVETEFWITVKLADGVEYDLTINPSYSENKKIGNQKFPFLKKRRYAGSNTRIKIRQVRAQYGIENLEDLAKHDSDNWWQINKDWNPEYIWGN